MALRQSYEDTILSKCAITEYKTDGFTTVIRGYNFE